jgi:succinate dehydrogenase / fumarate reductase cytochrome b subunit
MNWIIAIVGSSVGKKMLMALTGLGMIGFLAGHLLGNMMAFAGADAFNGYAHKLHSMQPYLSVFNIGLVTMTLVHIAVGITLFFENRWARPAKYRVNQNPGGRTFGSDTMPYTGVLILIFVISHLLKFTFTDKSVTPIYQQMAATFSNPLWVIFYVAAMVAVALHISHGIWSLFQTFGLNHPRYMPLVMKLGLVVTFVFGIGFGILPIFIMIAA